MNIFRRAPNLAPFSGGKTKGWRNRLKLKFNYVISQLKTHQQLPPTPQVNPHSCPSRSISLCSQPHFFLCCRHPGFCQSLTCAKLFLSREPCTCWVFLLESFPQLFSWMGPSDPEDFSLIAISSERPLRRILSNPLLSIGLYRAPFVSFFFFFKLSFWFWDNCSKICYCNKYYREMAHVLYTASPNSNILHNYTVVSQCGNQDIDNDIKHWSYSEFLFCLYSCVCVCVCVSYSIWSHVISCIHHHSQSLLIRFVI